MAAFPGGRFLF